MNRRALLTGTAAVVATAPGAALASVPPVGTAPPLELAWRYLSFLHYELSQLAASIGAETEDGIFLVSDGAVFDFFRSWFGHDPSFPTATERAARVLSAAGVDLASRPSWAGHRLTMPPLSYSPDPLLDEWRKALAEATASDDSSDAAEASFEASDTGKIVSPEWLERREAACGDAIRETERLFERVDELADEITARPAITRGNILARLEVAQSHLPKPGNCWGAKLNAELIAELRAMLRNGGAA